MGRWAGCIYKTKKITIAVVSVYQTVENTTHGPTSVHSQQVATLYSRRKESHMPWQAFLTGFNQCNKNITEEKDTSNHSRQF